MKHRYESIPMLETFRDLAEETTERLELIDHPNPRWNQEVKNVDVVLSASRSGSSLIFKALTSGEHYIAPAGEHEPWLFLSGNKFPFVPSDGIKTIHNLDTYLRLLRNDLLVRDCATPITELATLMRNRLTVRQLFRIAASKPTPDSLVNLEASRALLERPEGRDPLTMASSGARGSTFAPIENPPTYNSLLLDGQATMNYAQKLFCLNLRPTFIVRAYMKLYSQMRQSGTFTSLEDTLRP